MNRTVLLFICIVGVSCSEDNGTVNEPILSGCTDENALNYMTEAKIDDGSCEYSGCTDSSAVNYDLTATVNDGNCLGSEVIPNGYEFVWNDEFNAINLDESKWNIEIMPQGAVNSEKQEYTNNSENLYLENGRLIIASRKANPFNPASPRYTSGRINTKGKMQFQYGRVEVSAKIPAGTGTWPAIWMLGSLIDSVGWPTCGEVDIMEHVGFDEGNIHSSLHSNTLNHILGNNPHQIHFVENLTDDFHLFSVEWSDASFIFSVDNQSFFTYSKSDDMNVNDWPFYAPFFLIINLAIGGTWGGQQGIDNTIFPSRFLIEYVRLFKRN